MERQVQTRKNRHTRTCRDSATKERQRGQFSNGFFGLMRLFQTISHLCDCSMILIILPHLILYIIPKDVNNITNNVLTHLNYVMDVRYTVENILM